MSAENKILLYIIAALSKLRQMKFNLKEGREIKNLVFNRY